jgi:hypothetical protein
MSRAFEKLGLPLLKEVLLRDRARRRRTGALAPTGEAVGDARQLVFVDECGTHTHTSMTRRFTPEPPIFTHRGGVFEGQSHAQEGLRAHPRGTRGSDRFRPLGRHARGREGFLWPLWLSACRSIIVRIAVYGAHVGGTRPYQSLQEQGHYGNTGRIQAQLSWSSPTER